MPILPEYNVTEGRRAAAADRLEPSNTGIEALQQGARNISRLTTERAEYEKQAGVDWGNAFKEIGAAGENISRLADQHAAIQEAAAMGPAQGNLTQKLQSQFDTATMKQAAGDPTALQDFNDQMNEQLADFNDLPATQQGKTRAIDFTDKIRQHYLGAQTVVTSATASDAVLKSINTTASQVVQQAQDHPENAAMLMEGLKDHLTNLINVQGLSTETHQKLADIILPSVTSRVAKAVISNAAIDRPDVAEALQKQFGNMLTPEEHEAATNTIQAKYRLNQDLTAKQIAQDTATEKQATQEAVSVAMDKLFASGPNTVPDVAGATKALQDAAHTPGWLHDPTLGIEAYKTVNAVAESVKTGKTDIDDPRVVPDLQRRALLPPEDPDSLSSNPADMWRAKQNHQISNTSFELINQAKNQFAKGDLAQQMELRTVNAYFTQVENYFGVQPGSTNATPQGRDAFTKFIDWFTPNFAAATRSGQTPSQFIESYRAKGNEFLDTFQPPAQTNAGSGLYPNAAPPQRPSWAPAAPGVPGSAGASIPPAGTNPDGTESPLVKLWREIFK